MSTTRILIADDHPVFRNGLRGVLAQDGFDVIGECADGGAVVATAARLKPDVVILDISMPGTPTRQVAADLLAQPAGPAVIMLTMHEDPRYLREFLRLGVHGYLLKRSTGTELAQAVRAAARRERYVDPALAGSVLGGLLGGSDALPAGGGEAPSPREREVGGLLALGHTNQEIAEKLGISVRTVEGQRASLMRKLGLATRAELVRWAMAQGLLDDARHP
jgi:two-component system response regulator NreC